MINVIVAYDAKTRGIGYDNKLPWSLPNDLQHFYRTTVNQRVLMGVNTLSSVGKPLPKRENFVLTRNVREAGDHFLREGILTYDDPTMIIGTDSLLKMIGNARGNPEFDIWVIGGSQVYQALLPHADNVMATEVDVPEGELRYDTFFPDLPDRSVWLATDQKVELLHGAHDQYPFKVILYTRQPG